MKRSMIRALALMIALLLAVLPLSVAEEIAVESGQEPLAAVTEETSTSQELDEVTEVEAENDVVVAALESEVQESEDVDLDSEDLDNFDTTVYDEHSDELNIIDSASPFDQSVACGDVLISVTGVEGCFSEGAMLWAEKITDDETIQTVVASLPVEGTYQHNLFRIVVMDVAGNVILPNDGKELPLVNVKGSYVLEDIKVVSYDSISGTAFEIDAQSGEDGVEFAFLGSAVYDLMIQEKPEAQPVDDTTGDQPEGEPTDEPTESQPEGEPTDEPTESQPEGEPADEPTESQSEGVPENEEPSEEPQRNPVDETSSDEQPLEQPTQDDRAANDSVQPEDQEREEPEESAECKEETENQSDKSEVEPEDKGEWINTTVEHLTDDDGGMDIELDDADAVEAAKLADPQYAAMALTYQYLPSILTVGDVIDLKQCLLFDNYNPSDVVSWKSSNARAVKISKDGMLRALKTGKAKITVKTRDRKKRTISVSVRGNSIGGLFPKPTKGDAVALNGAFSIRPKSLKYSGTKLVAEFFLLNGYKKALYNIRGLSLNVFAGNRNNKIASQHFGRIKTRRSIKKGVSTFTVTFSGGGILQNNVHLMDYAANQIYFDLDVNAVYGKSGRKTVPFVATVIPNVPAPVLVSGIALNAESLSLNVGESARLTATVWPDNAENKAVTWSSSNSGVASVDSYGAVKANAAGTAIITARAEDGSGVTTSCTVTVVDPNAEVKATSVSFSPAAISINVGETTTLTGTVSPAGVSNSELQLYTSTSGVVEITKHTVRGNVNTITIKGLKKGSTTLTGYTKDGTQLSSNCKINVFEDKFNIKHGSELIMQSGETGKSIEMDPGMSSGDTYVLNIDSSYDWSVWTNDGTWMTLSPTRGSAGQTNLVMTLKNIEEGNTYSAKLAFTVEGVGTSLYVSLNKPVSGSLPNAPTNVTATAQGSDSIKVTWTKSTSNNVTGYKVYYSTNASSGSATWYNNKTYSSSTTSATITGLNAGTKYYVWVKATSSVGNSDFSNRDYDTTPTPSVTFSVSHDSLSNDVLTMSSSASAGASSTLKIECNAEWSAQLTNDNSGFLKLTKATKWTPSATINSTTTASGSSGTSYLTLEIVNAAEPGTTSKATLVFAVGGKTVKTVTVTQYKDIPAGTVSLTVHQGSSSGGTIGNTDIIKWPIGQTFTVACSQTNGNGKYLVKSYVTSKKPSFKESDVSNLVTGVAYQGTGYYYGKNGTGKNGNDEFGQSTMNALSFDCVGLSEGQYVKIWIGAEDQYYSSNEAVNGIQFALEMTNGGGSVFTDPRSMIHVYNQRETAVTSYKKPLPSIYLTYFNEDGTRKKENGKVVKPMQYECKPTEWDVKLWNNHGVQIADSPGDGNGSGYTPFIYGRGCVLLACAHAYQWFSGKANTRDKQVEILYKLGVDNPVNGLSKLGLSVRTMPASEYGWTAAKAVLDKGHVIFAQTTDSAHANLIVGYTIDSYRIGYVLVVDSSTRSTISRVIEAYEYNGTTVPGSKIAPSSSGYKDGVYWVKLSDERRLSLLYDISK